MNLLLVGATPGLKPRTSSLPGYRSVLTITPNGPTPHLTPHVKPFIKHFINIPTRSLQPTFYEQATLFNDSCLFLLKAEKILFITLRVKYEPRVNLSYNMVPSSYIQTSYSNTIECLSLSSIRPLSLLQISVNFSLVPNF